ncbi:MAG: sulfotransferase [Acidobacteriota bacterium]|nr:sulfotransferase [Acidobacteriota bacterium]
MSWFPRRVGVAFGEPVVELVKLGGSPLAFFTDTETRREAERLRVPLRDLHLVDGVQLGRDARPNGLIFHLPRSGSTLLSRLLSSQGNRAVVVEPEPIHALLSHDGLRGHVRPEWLRDLAGIYVSSLSASGYRQVYFKLASWTVLRIDLFEAAFPGIRICFVHRDPVEVAVQVLRRHTGWMAQDAREWMLGKTECADLDDAEYCARVLGEMCRRIAVAPSDILCLDHRDLPFPGVERSLEFFGQSAPEDRRRMSRLACLDTDDVTLATKWEDDAASLHDSASPRLQRLARELVTPSLRRLTDRARA